MGLATSPGSFRRLAVGGSAALQLLHLLAHVDLAEPLIPQDFIHEDSERPRVPVGAQQEVDRLVWTAAVPFREALRDYIGALAGRCYRVCS